MYMANPTTELAGQHLVECQKLLFHEDMDFQALDNAKINHQK